MSKNFKESKMLSACQTLKTSRDSASRSKSRRNRIKRRLSLNADNFNSRMNDTTITRFDSNASVKSACKTGCVTLDVRRHPSNRTRTAKCKLKPSIRDMTITDRRQIHNFGFPEYKTPKCTADCSRRPRNAL